MEDNIDSNVTVLAMLDNQSATYKQNVIPEYNHSNGMKSEETDTNETGKHNIIWTRNATLLLLNLYESKIHMIDNPKRKSKMWISMAEELKALNIEVTPDQVRWKINALTKKYKDSIENGQGNLTFKYFNEMHQILGQYNDDNETYRLASGVAQCDRGQSNKNTILSCSPYHKIRTERKAKVELDKQWLDYLKRQEEQKELRDQRYERSLRLKQEELELRKKELEIKESLALKKLQLKEKMQEEILKIEREKCALLRAFLHPQ
ncbi:PREDICTED: uncharacterized protein LOC106128449 [Papilio xuthus]|uniref:Uncharacterized protein LOC106128449 n=1 Tax=Papilio xuthus TaxID=66420 RepID=A0AAJ6ZZ08_PAPXU|nr:PREDICTED: uncharacterized protein LOC106128449 [Papilio xuthus]